MSPFAAYIGYTVLYSALFLLVEVIARKTSISKEDSRKLLHVLGGLCSLTLPYVIQSVPIVALLAGQYVALIIFAKRRAHLKSVHGVSRSTVGAELFPLAVFICFVASVYRGDPIFHVLPLAILTISDALAAIVGSRLPIRTYTCLGDNKSLGGSLAFFISALILGTFITTRISHELGIGFLLVVALVGMLAENLGSKGIDNILVPASVLALLMLY